jgi:single-strand DNA-binding protein
MSGVVQSLAKGDPVIVTGELRTNEYTTRDGVARTDLELSATAVGPDLARCTVVLDREPRAVAPVEATETSSTESASTDSVSTEQGAAETLAA